MFRNPDQLQRASERLRFPSFLPANRTLPAVMLMKDEPNLKGRQPAAARVQTGRARGNQAGRTGLKSGRGTGRADAQGAHLSIPDYTGSISHAGYKTGYKFAFFFQNFKIVYFNKKRAKKCEV